MTEHNDISLWQKILAGDEHAFSRLYLSYRPLLLHYGLKLCRDRELVEECMQELFCDLYLYKNQRPAIQNIKSYLFVAYRRDLLRMIQRNRKSVSLSVAEEVYDPAFSISKEDLLIEQEELAERKTALVHRLNGLSPRQREMLYLRYYDGLDNEEIAEVLNISYQVVHNTIYKAFKRLRELARADESPTFF